ncbi:MAG: DUF1295 domain-containing protein [Congregibacter sp.]
MMDTLLALVPLLAMNFAVAIGAVLLLWLISIPLRDVSIIDMVFALIMTAIVCNSVLQTAVLGGADKLMLGLILAWALRVTVHLVRRNWGHGEDPRYSKLRTWVEGEWAFHWLSLRKVFLLQGVVLWFATSPAQVAILLMEPSDPVLLTYLGAAIAALGLFWETVADIQLTAFRKNPALKGTVLQTGLWRYSRHPNYFGELCFWWGVFLMACANPLALVTIIGPLAYSHLIVNVTGQATLDKKLAREKPDYADYMQRTNGMLPWPPKPRS